MIEEDKQLLLIDLCARLPYKIIVKVNDTQGIMDEIDIPNERIFVSNLNPFLYGGARASWFTVNGDKIYPYLRPMSSITEKEKEEVKPLFSKFTDEFGKRVLVVRQNKMVLYQDWLNKNMFDYRGLIPMSLALEVPEGMYNLNK